VARFYCCYALKSGTCSVADLASITAHRALSRSTPNGTCLKIEILWLIFSRRVQPSSSSILILGSDSERRGECVYCVQTRTHLEHVQAICRILSGLRFHSHNFIPLDIASQDSDGTIVLHWCGLPSSYYSHCRKRYISVHI
jgi:hypothetical protein